MEIRNLVHEQLYTNSLLISPNSDENPPAQFYWLKKNSFFSTTKDKIVIKPSLEHFYQCNLFDFQATFELVVKDKKGSTRIYVFGPIQLQPDLASYLKTRQLNYKNKLVMNKKQSVETTTTIISDSIWLKLNLQLDNGFNLVLHYPKNCEETDYQALVKVEDHEPSHVYLNFSHDRKMVVELLKKMKIYSYQGNFLKLLFKTTHQRDLFLLNFFLAVGFSFQLPKNNPKSTNFFSEKTVETQNREVETSSEFGQHNYFPQFHSDFHQNQQRFSQAKKENNEHLETPISKIDQKDGFTEHFVNDSIALQLFQTKNNQRFVHPQRKKFIHFQRNMPYPEYQKAVTKKSESCKNRGKEKVEVSPKEKKMIGIRVENRKKQVHGRKDERKGNEIWKTKQQQHKKDIPEFIKTIKKNQDIKRKINHIHPQPKNSPSPQPTKKTSPFCFSKPQIKRYNSNGSFKVPTQPPKNTIKAQYIAPKVQPASIKSMPFLPKYMGGQEEKRMSWKAGKK